MAFNNSDVLSTLKNETNTTNCSQLITQYNNMSLIIKLNHEKALFFLPVTISIGTITLFSLIANTFVCYIYRTKFKQTTGNFFVVCLSIIDILSCLTASPFELFDMSQPYFTGNIVCCKLFRFIELTVNFAAGIMLVSIAFDRHRKVNDPLRCYTLGQARQLVVVTIAISLSVSWPQLVLSGSRTVQTGLDCVVGEDCSIASEFEGSVYTLLAYFTQYVIFLIAFLLIIVLYCHIIFIIANRKRTLSVRQNKVVSPQNSVKQLVTPQNSGKLDVTSQSSVVPDQDFKIHVSKGSKKIRPNKTTMIMLTVAFTTILCYVPYLSIEVMKHNKIVFKPGMSAGLEILSEICVKSYFLSRAINPIIYFVISDNFRFECFKLIKSWINRPSVEQIG